MVQRAAARAANAVVIEVQKRLRRSGDVAELCCRRRGSRRQKRPRSASGRHGMRSVDGGDKGAADNECREGGRRKGKTLTGWYNRGEEEGVATAESLTHAGGGGGVVEVEMEMSRERVEVEGTAVGARHPLVDVRGERWVNV